ncbi:MAG: hypothetical protein J2P54_21740, partial [Bradyrhizobiaceae bacterium]|nr:hypothetical protein [Bradyrhizobiaceae bacterium]
MKFGRPWNVAGVRPRAQETARTAARRSRVTVGEWLDSAIIERAAEEGIDLPARHDDGNRHREDVAAINDRVTHLTKQLDRIERTGGGAHGDERSRDRDAIAHLDQRIDHVITEGRFAVREIERRAMSIDQALSNLGRARLHGAYLAPQSHPPIELAETADSAKQHVTDTRCAADESHLSRRNLDLSRLEQQLARISRQIDTMARPCNAEAVAEALRAGLADIKGVIKTTVPARALEAIENEIRSLVERLDAERDRGIDSAALAGLERSLAEVREEVRRHAPAKHLAGFDQAVQTLSKKIDAMAAGLPDPGALQRIDEDVAAVRSMVSQLASNDALASVARDVRLIAMKLERITTAPAQSPSDQASQTASALLENKVTQLAQKVDASEARLTRLGSVERGLAELVQHLERIRARNAQAVSPVEPAVSGTNDEAVEALRRRVDALIHRRAIEQRTERAAEAVEGTVGDVSGRVAEVECDVRQGARPFVATDHAPVS